MLIPTMYTLDSKTVKPKNPPGYIPALCLVISMGSAGVFADPDPDNNDNDRRFYIHKHIIDGAKEYIDSKYMIPDLQWEVPINERDILSHGDTVESYVAELKANWQKEQEKLKKKEEPNQDGNQSAANHPETDKENKPNLQSQDTGSSPDNKSDSSGSSSEKDKKAELDKQKKEDDKQKVKDEGLKKEQPTQAQNQVNKQQQETPAISSAVHSFHLMQHVAFTASSNISKHFDSRFERGINTGSSFTRNNFWGNINYLTGKNKTNLTGEYDLNSTGVTIGYDFAPNELLDYAFGIAFTYASGKTDPNNKQIKLEQDLYLGSLYSNFLFKQFDMLAALHFGSGSNEQKLQENTKNNYDSKLWGISLQGGYVISTRQINIKPLMEFNYLSASFDDVNVGVSDPSGVNAKIQNSDITVSEIGAGVQLFKTCDIKKRGELRLNGQLMAYHDFNDDKHDTSLSLLPSSPRVTTTFKDQIKTQERFKAGAGVGFQTAKNLSVDLNYDYFWNDKSDVSAVSLQFGFLF